MDLQLSVNHGSSIAFAGEEKEITIRVVSIAGQLPANGIIRLQVEPPNSKQLVNLTAETCDTLNCGGETNCVEFGPVNPFSVFECKATLKFIALPPTGVLSTKFTMFSDLADVNPVNNIVVLDFYRSSLIQSVPVISSISGIFLILCILIIGIFNSNKE